MNIIVCVKGIVTNAAAPAVREDGSGLATEGDRFINVSDDYALELALALRPVLGGTVTVMTVGPIQCQDILHVAVAKGVDEVLRIDSDEFDPNVVSFLLERAISSRDYGLVLTGVESADGMTSQVGTSLGARLGIPYLFAVTKVESSDGGTLKAQRELGGGRFQTIELSPPSLLCVQSGIVPLTYAPVVKLIHARRRAVPAVSPSDLGIDESELAAKRKTRMTAVNPVAKSTSTQWLKGDSEQLAAEILNKIAEVM